MDSFDPQLLDVSAEPAELLARKCRSCDAVTLVASERCAVCQEPTDIFRISGGVVVALCEAQFPLHGLTPPVQVAQVRCGAVIDVVGVCTEPVEVGDEVTLEPIEIEGDAGKVAGYAFRCGVAMSPATGRPSAPAEAGSGS